MHGVHSVFCVELEHDAETGEVGGKHELYGHLDGDLRAGVLSLTSIGRTAEVTEPAIEPEPEALGSAGEDGPGATHLRCKARVLLSADKTRWVIVGEWLNVPRPMGATASEGPSAVDFIGHMTGTTVPVIARQQFDAESSESDSDLE